MSQGVFDEVFTLEIFASDNALETQEPTWKRMLKGLHENRGGLEFHLQAEPLVGDLDGREAHNREEIVALLIC